MTAVIAGGMAAAPFAAPPALQQHQLAPLPAARLDAYTKVMRIFLQGSYDLAKEEALASLRSALHISEQEHLSVKAAAMADVQHHLQLHSHPAQQPAPAPEPSVGHSSQPAGAAAAAKRPSPAAAAKGGAAASRKRTRAGEAAARGQAAGPAVPAPRAAGGVALDPLVGHVVMRHWPADGGWFRGVVSDYNADTGSHCITYDLGSSSESFEWYRIRGASQQDCIVQEEKVDFALLAPPPAGGAAATAKSRKSAGGGAASGAASRAGASKQAGGAGKAAAARAAGAAKPAAGAARPAAKPAAARAAAARPATKPAAVPPAGPPPAQQPAAAAPQQQPAAPHRNGKTHALHGGLSSHAAALKQALASGARPPYLNGHTLLPRRTRSWSSDEDSSDEDDDE